MQATKHALGTPTFRSRHHVGFTRPHGMPLNWSWPFLFYIVPDVRGRCRVCHMGSAKTLKHVLALYICFWSSFPLSYYYVRIRNSCSVYLTDMYGYYLWLLHIGMRGIGKFRTWWEETQVVGFIWPRASQQSSKAVSLFGTPFTRKTFSNTTRGRTRALGTPMLHSGNTS